MVNLRRKARVQQPKYVHGIAGTRSEDSTNNRRITRSCKPLTMRNRKKTLKRKNVYGNAGRTSEESTSNRVTTRRPNSISSEVWMGNQKKTQKRKSAQRNAETSSEESANNKVITRTQRQKRGELAYLRPQNKLVFRTLVEDISEVYKDKDMTSSAIGSDGDWKRGAGRPKKKKRNFANFSARIRKLVETFKTNRFPVVEPPPPPPPNVVEAYKTELFEHVHTLVEKINFQDLEHWIVLHPWIIQFQTPADEEAQSCQSDPSVMEVPNQADTVPLFDYEGTLFGVFQKLQTSIRHLTRVGKKNLLGHTYNPADIPPTEYQMAEEINTFMEFVGGTLEESEVEGTWNPRLPNGTVITLSPEEQDNFRELARALIHAAKIIRFVYKGGQAVRAQLVPLKTVVQELLTGLGKVVLPVTHAHLLNAQYSTTFKVEPASRSPSPVKKSDFL